MARQSLCSPSYPSRCAQQILVRSRTCVHWRQCDEVFWDDEGCSIISTGACTFSTPMTEAEIDTLVGAFKSGFAKLASMG